jgi:putative transposase
MKIEYNNLYTHFIFSTLHRLPVIEEKNRQRIEKYITGIVNNNDSHMYLYTPTQSMFIFLYPGLQN